MQRPGAIGIGRGAALTSSEIVSTGPSCAPAAVAYSSARRLAFTIASLRASSFNVPALLTSKAMPLIWLAPSPMAPSRISPSRFTSRTVSRTWLTTR